MTDTDRDLLLTGARVVTPAGVREDLSLHVAGGRIRSLLPAGAAAPAGAEALDLAGALVLPGFIDMHIHGALGVDTTEADAEDLRRVAAHLASRGTTAWLPTLVPAPDDSYTRAARAVSELMRAQDDDGARPAARALGLHYEGPFVNERQCGALRTEFFRTYEGAHSVEPLARVEAEGAVHMTTLAPEVGGGVELVRELCARGWVVSIGHTRAGLDVLEAAREAGARHLTHFMNAMPQLHHREPGPVGFGLTADDVTCDLISDGVHTDPLTVRLVVRCKTPERVALISDAVAPAGLGDGEYRLWGETISVVGGRTRNERGSIAGSVITILDAARLCAAHGHAVADISRMASAVPARVLRIDRDYGTIEPGKRADLVALDDDWNVTLTLVGGRPAFNDEARRAGR